MRLKYGLIFAILLLALGACALPSGRVTESGCVSSCEDDGVPGVYRICVQPTRLGSEVECSDDESEADVEACPIESEYPARVERARGLEP